MNSLLQTWLQGSTVVPPFSGYGELPHLCSILHVISDSYRSASLGNILRSLFTKSALDVCGAHAGNMLRTAAMRGLRLQSLIGRSASSALPVWRASYGAPEVHASCLYEM